MDGQVRIESVYAFIVLDDDGTEGIPAFSSPSGPMPAIGADLERVEILEPSIRAFAEESGKPVYLVHFQNRVEVQTYPVQVPRPEPLLSAEQRNRFLSLVYALDSGDVLEGEVELEFGQLLGRLIEKQRRSYLPNPVPPVAAREWDNPEDAVYDESPEEDDVDKTFRRLHPEIDPYEGRDVMPLHAFQSPQANDFGDNDFSHVCARCGRVEDHPNHS